MTQTPKSGVNGTRRVLETIITPTAKLNMSDPRQRKSAAKGVGGGGSTAVTLNSQHIQGKDDEAKQLSIRLIGWRGRKGSGRLSPKGSLCTVRCLK